MANICGSSNIRETNPNVPTDVSAPTNEDPAVISSNASAITQINVTKEIHPRSPTPALSDAGQNSSDHNDSSGEIEQALVPQTSPPAMQKRQRRARKSAASKRGKHAVNNTGVVNDNERRSRRLDGKPKMTWTPSGRLLPADEVQKRKGRGKKAAKK